MRILLSAAAFSAAGSAQDAVPAYQGPPEDLPREVAPQPIPFSHRLHAEAGAVCADCHRTARTGARAGLPDAERCLLCHRAIATESEEVQKLAALAREGLKIDWVPVYDVPDFVFFSHQRHLAGGVGCVDCHGPVERRDVLAQEISVGMTACMNCHRERRASNECFICHDLGQ